MMLATAVPCEEVIRTGLVHSAQEELFGHLACRRSFNKSAVGEVDTGVDRPR